MTTSAKPASAEQLGQIRRSSKAMFGSETAVFDAVGTPTARDRASQILTTLQRIRHAGPNKTDEMISELVDGVGIEKVKTCSHCKESKPLDEFHKNKARRDGYQGECKTCVSATGKNRRAGSKAAYSKPVPEAPSRKNRRPTRTNQTTVTSTTVSGDGLVILSDDWKRALANPPLSKLRQIQSCLGIPTLDETADVCQQLTREPVPV